MSENRRCFLRLGWCLVLTAMATSQVGFGQESARTDFAPGEVIVKFRTPLESQAAQHGSATRTGNSTLDSIALSGSIQEVHRLFPDRTDALLGKSVTLPIGLTVAVPDPRNIYRLRFSGEPDVRAIVRRLTADPDVVFAEPNYIARATAQPNDPMYDGQWALRKIKADSAWAIQTGDTSVVIGILDTGLDLLHQDLKDNIWTNPDEIPANGLDDDGNGYVDDVHGWNMIGKDNSPADDAGHGTHVAGIVGGVTNNGLGVAGVTWHSRLMAVKVLNANGLGLYSDIAEGIGYAAANGATVINMSLGGEFPSVLMETALLNAYMTSLLVGSAGNDDRSEAFYPAAYPMVLAVTGLDSADARWSRSNYGLWVDIAAPAVSILSAKLNSTFGELTGTSMSAGFVSGAGALVRAMYPSLDPGSVFNQIVERSAPVENVKPGFEGMLGTGRLDVFAAVAIAPEPDIVVGGIAVIDNPPAGDGDGVPDAGESVTMKVTVLNIGRSVDGLTGRLDVSDAMVHLTQGVASFGTVLARDSAEGEPGFGVTVDASAPNDHPVEFSLVLSGSGGYVDTVKFVVRTQRQYDLKGLISSDLTLTRERLYVVTGNVLVQSGVTLSAEPGVVVKLNPGVSLRVDGSFYAIGTPTDSIYFTANAPSPAPGFWEGITYKGPSATFDSLFNHLSGSRLQYVVIRDAVNGMIGPAYVSDISVSYCSNNGIGSCPVLRRARIRNSGVGLGGGITFAEDVEVSGCALGMATSSTVRSCTVTRNTEGVQASGRAHISSSVIADNASTGLVFNGEGDAYSCLILDSTDVIRNGSDGVQVRAESLVVIRNNTITHNGGHGIRILRAGWVGVEPWLVKGNQLSFNGSWGLRKDIEGRGMMIAENTCNGNVGGMTLVNDTLAANSIVFNKPDPTSGTSGLYGTAECLGDNNIVSDSGLAWRTRTSGVATLNWWGTTSASRIDSLIYDFFDDWNLGTVTYQPFLAGPSQSAPAYVTDVITSPPSPVGIQNLEVTVVFSRPMDLSVQPSLSLIALSGEFRTIDQGAGWIDSTHFVSGVRIDEMVDDGTHRIAIAGARDRSGYPAAPDSSRTLIVYSAGSASRELKVLESGARVRLSWRRASLTNLLGYHVYRSLQSGGPYERVNSKIVADTVFVDSLFSATGTYYYVYTIMDGTFRETGYSNQVVASAVMDVGRVEGEVPKVFSLFQNHPNPFNPSTTIRYGLPVRQRVNLAVFNALGQQVATLAEGEKEAGYHESRLDGSNLPSGIYFYRLQAGDFEQTKRLLLLK